jgi:hypothetical protein
MEVVGKPVPNFTAARQLRDGNGGKPNFTAGTSSSFLNFIHRDKHILKPTNTVKQLYISTSRRI